MLPLLQSISEISRVIDTNGSMPVVVLAENLEDYACKYDHKNKLINEYLAHQFLIKWELPVLPAAFVKIKKEHIPQKYLQGRIRLIDFEKPTFGLQYNNDATDASNTLLGLKNDNYELGKFSNRLDLLKIALFDLWVANDDRNHNNYNILIVNNQFIPIDHSNIFDGGRLGNQLAQLTEDDSLLTSDLALTFLNQKTKVEEEANKLIQNFPTFVKNCNGILPEIIEGLPDEWCNDKQSLLKVIKSSVIDNDDWLDETISSFSQLIHKFIR
jgi:hypothetical protein